VDLKSDEGRPTHTALVHRADVVVENFRAGVLDRRGFAIPTLCARIRGLVVLSISGSVTTGRRAVAPGTTRSQCPAWCSGRRVTRVGAGGQRRAEAPGDQARGMSALWGSIFDFGAELRFAAGLFGHGAQ
jgi:hypothetical protein